tara:strand:+ start:4340 stop:4960 length:621 start_codon:yes stop_codon:yes gene_type:complete
MRNILIVLTFVCCNVLIAGTALATPIHTDQHNYGRLSYNPLTSGSCGTIATDFMLVRSGSCTAVTDAFSLTGFNPTTTDYIELNVTFAATNNRYCLRGDCLAEQWQLYILNASGDTLGKFDLSQSSGVMQQRVLLNRLTLTTFTDLLNQDNLWFSVNESSGNNHSFRLISSQLTVYAMPTAIPQPATLALLTLGLAGFGLRRKTQQ